MDRKTYVDENETRISTLRNTLESKILNRMLGQNTLDDFERLSIIVKNISPRPRLQVEDLDSDLFTVYKSRVVIERNFLERIESTLESEEVLLQVNVQRSNVVANVSIYESSLKRNIIGNIF